MPSSFVLQVPTSEPRRAAEPAGAGDLVSEVTTRDKGILETVPQGCLLNTFPLSLVMMGGFFHVVLVVLLDDLLGIWDFLVMLLAVFFTTFKGSGSCWLSSAKLVEAVNISRIINFLQALGIYVVG